MRKRLELVQAYRGIVAILILVSHVSIIMHDYTATFDFFYLIGRSGGVDFFFTLSGFLIYYVYSGYQGNKAKIVAFVEKRCLRIFPLVWFFTLLSLPVYAVFNTIGNGNELNVTVIVKSLFLIPQREPVLGATWSLSHIILFYMFFALYMFYPKVMKYIVAVYACLILLKAVLGYAPSGEIIKSILSPYNLNFAAGALCAYFVLRYGSKIGYTAITAGISGFLLNWLFHYYNLTMVPLEPIYLLSSICLLYGASKIDGIKKLPKIFDILGDASYSIIITNLPITIMCSKLMEKLGLFGLIGFPLSVVAVLLVSTIGGVVAYYLVEKPLAAKITQMYYNLKNHRVFRYRSETLDQR
ncbi:acyltransferase family protein [Paenibacillus tarimensis]